MPRRPSVLSGMTETGNLGASRFKTYHKGRVYRTRCLKVYCYTTDRPHHVIGCFCLNGGAKRPRSCSLPGKDGEGGPTSEGRSTDAFPRNNDARDTKEGLGTERRQGRRTRVTTIRARQVDHTLRSNKSVLLRRGRSLEPPPHLRGGSTSDCGVGYPS